MGSLNQRHPFCHGLESSLTSRAACARDVSCGADQQAASHHGWPAPETPGLLQTSKWLLAPGSLHWNCPALCEPEGRHACSKARSFLWRSAPPPLFLPSSGALLLLCVPVQNFSQVLSAVVFHSQAYGIPFPAHGTLHLIPLGCLHTANPSPLPGTDLWSLSFSAQPPP